MLSEAKGELRAAAIGWHLRLRDGGDADWAAFTVWLEADPARADAYDAVRLADEGLDGLVLDAKLLVAANDAEPPPPRRSGRWFAALGAAAVAAGVVVFVRTEVSPPPSLDALATAPGERRTLALGDGSTVEMNGGTTLRLDRSNARRVELAEGEALFTVRHDASTPFTVTAGDDRVVDVGTTFNVLRSAGGTSVAVSSGSVRFNPDRENVALGAGDTLAKPARGPLVRTHGDAAAAGSWRYGRLDFDRIQLAQVAASLTRNTGLTVSVDPAIAGRPFSGTVMLNQPPRQTIERVAALAGVAAHPDGKGWRLSPRP